MAPPAPEPPAPSRCRSRSRQPKHKASGPREALTQHNPGELRRETPRPRSRPDPPPQRPPLPPFPRRMSPAAPLGRDATVMGTAAPCRSAPLAVSVPPTPCCGVAWPRTPGPPDTPLTTPPQLWYSPACSPHGRSGVPALSPAPRPSGVYPLAPAPLTLRVAPRGCPRGGVPGQAGPPRAAPSSPHPRLFTTRPERPGDKVT